MVIHKYNGKMKGKVMYKRYLPLKWHFGLSQEDPSHSHCKFPDRKHEPKT